MKTKIEQLNETYERRLSTVEHELTMLINNDADEHDRIKLSTKMSCYRTLISELTQIIHNQEKIPTYEH